VAGAGRCCSTNAPRASGSEASGKFDHRNFGSQPSRNVAGVDRNPSQPECPEILLERKNVFDIELVAENAIEVVDKRDLLVVGGGKLLRCAVEDRFGHLE
jgi:hypothetical protein